MGAAYWQTPLQLETFSSIGGTPILFDISGNRLQPAEIRSKPNVVGPDGGSTTFFYSSDSDGDGFPDFFGTSASAPHVAAVAALMLEANPGLLPLDIYSAMESTAVDMDDPGTSGFDTGVDFATGHGFVQADAAIASVSVDECNVNVDPLVLNFGTQNVAATQSLSVNLSNLGRADCNLTGISLSGSSDFEFTATPPTTPFILTPGDSVEVSLNYTPAEEGSDAGALTINSDDPDQGTIQVSLSGSGFLEKFANLSIAKIALVNPVTQGDNITYRITVANNNGPDDATGLIVEDNLPSEVTLVAPLPAGCAEAGGLVTCTLSSLAYQDSESWDIIVTADSAGTIFNQATISANESDPDPGDNTAGQNTQVDGIPVPASADLSIRKDADQKRPRVGSILTYTITVTNNGPDEATGIVIQDTLPPTVQFQSASNECTDNGSTVTCNIDSIIDGAAKSVDIRVQLGSKGRIENSVTVSGIEDDQNPSNNVATRRTRVR